MMDANLKVKLVEALRSGEYPQGSGYLERNGQYCCLGVLCAIQDKDWKKQFDGQLDPSLYTETLPDSLNAGLTAADRRALAQRNDDGDPFSEIANYIERNL